MPISNTKPPAIISQPICFEPNLLAVKKDVADIIKPGATLIEINCKIFAVGSTGGFMKSSNNACPDGSSMKLKIEIISPTNIAYKPIPAIAIYAP